jgi:tetratricopeptide (TPR) repeat protein
MLVLTAFLTLARSYAYLTSDNRSGAILYFSMFVAQLIAVIGSMTRGAWVGFFAGIVVWIIVTGMVITGRNKKIFVRVVSIALIVGIVLFVATGLLLGNKFPVFSRLKTIFVWYDSHGRPIPRLILWRDTMTLIKDNMSHGRLTGVGIEVFRRNFMPYKSLELSQSEPKVNYDDPHNNYLSVWAKTGIIGILAYISMFLAALIMAYKYLKTEPSEQYRIIMAGLVASLLGYAANLLTIFDTLSTALFFYIFLGIIAATYYLEDVPVAEKEQESINLPVAKGIALIMVIAFVLVGVIGSYNYIQLWRADGYFRTGISYLNASQSGGRINPQFLQTAMEYLEKAYDTYPEESYYSLNLAKAYGTAAYVLKSQGKMKDAEKTYELAKQVALSHEKDTWSPENLYMILGFNAYYMDKLGESTQYMEDIFKWDHWFYGAHVSTSQIFYIKWQKEHKLSDLESSWKHANTARIVLRFYPTYGLNGFQLTYQEGYMLLTEYLKTSTTSENFDNVLKSSLDALLVYSGYKNPGEYATLYKNFVETLSASGKLTSTDDIQPRIDIITALAQYQSAKDTIENIKKQIIDEKTKDIKDTKQKQAIINDINANLLKYLDTEQKDKVISAVKQIKTALQNLKNIHVPDNFKLTDDSSLAIRLKTFIGYIESYLNKLGNFTSNIQAENVTPQPTATATQPTTTTQSETGTQ